MTTTVDLSTPVTSTSTSTSGTSRAVAPLSADELAFVTRRYAARLRRGEFGAIRFGDPSRPGDPSARWHVRVHASDVVDVWLISWLPSQGTQLHDHGGSSGAFTVVAGELSEAVWVPSGSADAPRRGALTDRRRPKGATVVFGTEHVHDVRNLGTEPAVSVHAYSHPLTRMGYYDIDQASLHLTSVLDTTDPEPAS